MTLAKGVKQLMVQEVLQSLAGVVLFTIHTHHKYEVIHRWAKDDDSLGSTLQVSPGLLHGSKNTSGLHNMFSTHVTPSDVSGFSVLADGSGLS